MDLLGVNSHHKMLPLCGDSRSLKCHFSAKDQFRQKQNCQKILWDKKIDKIIVTDLCRSGCCTLNRNLLTVQIWQQQQQQQQQQLKWRQQQQQPPKFPSSAAVPQSFKIGFLWEKRSTPMKDKAHASSKNLLNRNSAPSELQIVLSFCWFCNKVLFSPLLRTYTSLPLDGAARCELFVTTWTLMITYFITSGSIFPTSLCPRRGRKPI